MLPSQLVDSPKFFRKVALCRWVSLTMAWGEQGLSTSGRLFGSKSCCLLRTANCPSPKRILEITWANVAISNCPHNMLNLYLNSNTYNKGLQCTGIWLSRSNTA